MSYLETEERTIMPEDEWAQACASYEQSRAGIVAVGSHPCSMRSYAYSVHSHASTGE